jgi:diguanylate cyclase (GGDEF)-like protein
VSRTPPDPRSPALLAALEGIASTLRSDEIRARLLRAALEVGHARGVELGLDVGDERDSDGPHARGEVRGDPERVLELRARDERLGELRIFGAHDEIDAVALDALAAFGAQALLNARAHAALLLRAERDALTGLANHGHVWEALEREAARADRYGRALAFVMFDVDLFKPWNDRFGHLAGDEALVRIAALVRERSRASDTAGRYGGDELALVLPETTHEGAIAVAEKIRAATQALALSDVGPGLTLSAGVASTPADGKTAADLVRVADARLYVAKAANGNRVIA